MMKNGYKLVLMGLLLAASLPLTASAASNDRYAFKLTEARSDNTMDLDKLTADKPLVFLVWSPECPHCQRQMPYVASLYGQVDQAEVNFYTCSVDAPVGTALDYLERKDLELPVLDGNKGQLGSGFTSLGWPTTFVFAAGGELVGWCDTTGTRYVDEVLSLVDKAKELSPAPVVESEPETVF
jgi:thiol-disulfide isomerase/thioredoxin